MTKEQFCTNLKKGIAASIDIKILLQLADCFETYFVSKSIPFVASYGSEPMHFLVCTGDAVDRRFASICRQLDIAFLRDNTACFLDNNTNGLTYIRNNKYHVILNGKNTVEIQRLTAAHELAHIILGHLLPECDSLSLAQKEFEAESLGYMLYSYINNPFYSKEQKHEQ